MTPRSSSIGKGFGAAVPLPRRAPFPGRRIRLPCSVLRDRLDALGRVYDRRFLDSDPIGIVREYRSPEDREVVALLAAGLAYGRVASIRASLRRVLAVLGERPARAVDAFDPRRGAASLEGFAHRFTRGRDVALVLWVVRQARARSGSLEEFFLEGDDDPTSETLEAPMNRFGDRLFALDAGPFTKDGRIGRRDGARWLLPLPRDGSACKRHCLFLRWMVRADDGVDCGAWRRLTPARLVLPLDVHVQRLARVLGWTSRRAPGWAMALEVTACLRRLDPRDPTRYDFALSRLGILGHLRASQGRLRLAQVREVLRDVTRPAPAVTR